MLKKFRRFSLCLIAAASVSGLTGCWKQKQAAAPAAPKPHVTVSKAVYGAYTERYSFPARVDAVESVTLKTRVSGFLKERLFEEGDTVKKGQLLFTIEREPFEAQVAEAAANLAKAQADAKNARLNYDRALELRKTGNISQATVDSREAESTVAKAAVLQAEAALNIAKLNLGYTEVKAPFTGKIGLSAFSSGEYLPANTVLAQIVSFDPINVIFSVSEQELLSMQKAGVFDNNGNLSVSMVMADSSVYRYNGQINFTDVTVNDGTDTIKVRAVFPNPEKRLVSGQFVSLLMEYESPTEKILIPQAAVLSSVASKYVYVVDAQNKILNKPIRVGLDQGTNIVVLSGLEAGERVVSEGIQKVRPGQEVVVDTPAPALPAKTAEPAAVESIDDIEG